MTTAPVAKNRTLERSEFLDWYRRNRERSKLLFSLVDASQYYERPIPLRNPIVFYEGHLPAFSFNTLLKKALGRKSIDARLEELFARGIDPAAPGDVQQLDSWPTKETVDAFNAEIDARIEDAIRSEDLDRPGDPMLDGANALYTILEHEAMHHETLCYLLHRIPHDRKKKPARLDHPPASGAHSQEMITIHPGVATLGADASLRFAWDNEYPPHEVEVDEFEIDSFPVTNGEFLEFLEDGAYEQERYWREHWSWLRESGTTHPLFWERHGDRWQWRGMFEMLDLPMNAPVYVTLAEAKAYARWKWKRLPTEAEFHRAAYGTPEGSERAAPWREALEPSCAGNFDFQSFDPVPNGSFPLGASAWGVHDLVGNGWEWTQSVFAPFDGFARMPSYPEYSADFFDGEHYVIKGASPVTARELVRRSFRNWFRPTYPYVYAKFRCVSD